MAQLQTFDGLAEVLCPQLLDTSEHGLVSKEFLRGGKPKREHWKKLINAVFYAPLMRRAMADYLSRPPEMTYDDMWRYTSEIEFMQGYVSDFDHASLPARFDPEQDLTHLLMAQRVSHKQVIENFAMLERNPHFLVTIAHMQQFFVDYVEKLEPCVLAKVDPHRDDVLRIKEIFQQLKKVVRGNQGLFVGVMAMQFMAVHAHLARQEERPAGDMTLKDFLAFDRYVRSGKLFVQQGAQCPWSDAYRLGMQGKEMDANGGLMNVSGIQLWRLHTHVEPAALVMRDVLRQHVQLAGTAFSEKVQERLQRSTNMACPHRPVPADGVLVAKLAPPFG